MHTSPNKLYIATTLVLIAGELQPLCAQPNIVYIFPDQMRNHAMEFWQESPYKAALRTVADPVYTPTLNQLAQESVVFSSAMSNCPLSSPHRGMMLTGAYPHINGVILNCNSTRPNSSLRTDITTISDVLSEHGYDCGYIGKLHTDHPTANDPQNPGHYVENKTPVWDAYTPKERRHGFNYWYSYGTYDVHKAPHYWDNQGQKHQINEWSPQHEASQAIAYIKNEKGTFRDPQKPFFLMISMNPPHHPYNSLEDVMEEDYIRYKDKSPTELLVRPNANRTLPKASEAPYYFASVTGVDREIGRILQALKEQSLEENTIIVFTSDHGETMCSQNTTDPKNSPYSESMNVPMLIKYPKQLTPRIDTTLLSTADICPTLLGLAGLSAKIPSTVQGYNYAPHLIDPTLHSPLDKVLYIQNMDGAKDQNGQVIDYFPRARGIKTDRYTLVYYLNKQTKELEKTLFFDDHADPYQMNNLRLESYPEAIAQLNKGLVELLKQSKDRWVDERILSSLLPYQ